MFVANNNAYLSYKTIRKEREHDTFTWQIVNSIYDRKMEKMT